MAKSSGAKEKKRKLQRTPLSSDEKTAAESKATKLREVNPEAFKLRPSKRTAEELAVYFEKSHEASKRILPKEKRRYVIYLRKSTDDESKQVRSLEDQKTECLLLANQLGISIREEDIFEESASAKKSGNRPIFDEVVLGFKKGKYHGLLAWSPDRLSRNMKEAGEIIEMIDLEEIQDLHFKTYQFENSPNGKMLLGILFATSKQYSDKLSVDVKRGTDGNIKDGKYNGSLKKGYYADSATGYFMPDGYNWDLLRVAVNMRLYERKTNVEIAEFLNNSHFSARGYEDEELRRVKVTKTMVGNIFEDPFYFGLYKYGNKIVLLSDNYNFLPLFTPDEYIELNKDIADNFGVEAVGRRSQSKRLEYGLLRGKVICDLCNQEMKFQNQLVKRGKNEGRYVISFYCRNKECPRRTTVDEKTGKPMKSSIRAVYISAAIEWTIRHLTIKSREAYQEYIDKLTIKLAQDKAIAKRKMADAKADLKQNKQQYFKYQAFQVDHPKEYEKHHKGKLELYQERINASTFAINELRENIEKLNNGLPSEQEFYELINSYLETMLFTEDLVATDIICNELVTNLRANNDYVSVITLNPPYDLMVDLPKISTGRGGRT